MVPWEVRVRSLLCIVALLALVLAGPGGAGYALASADRPAVAGPGAVPLFLPTGFTWSADSELAWLGDEAHLEGVGYDYWQFNQQNLKLGSFSARVLAPGQVPGLEAVAPLPGESVLEAEQPYGGYLALEWRAKSWGVTIGGGYSRSYDLGGSEMAPAAPLRRVAASFSKGSNSPGAGGTTAQDRWSAFLALPYQISERVGVRPEVSFSYESRADRDLNPGNEWVMGLQFSFGF